MTPYYSDDLVTIYHGDCRELLPIINLPRPCVLLTDPPYGIGWRRGVHQRRNSKAHAGIVGDEDTSLRDAVIDSLADVPGIVFGSFYADPPPRTRGVLVWHKPADAGLVGSTTGFRRDVEPIFLIDPWPIRTVERSSVLRVERGQAATVAETGHPHTKPRALIAQLLVAAPDGLVLDPFAGSGSTLVAAKDLGRKAMGIEIDERYCEIAANRCRQETLGLSA